MRHAPAALVSRYARSLFAVALGKNLVKEVREDLRNVGDVWHGDPELALLLLNPGLTREKSHAILGAVADRLKLADLSRHFLFLLLDKDRLEVLYDMADHFDQLCRDHQGEVEVKVFTAIAVSEQLQSQIRETLAAQSGKIPLITWQQEPDLLGGIIVQWPDKIFDGSLARKLENMKAHIARSA